MGRRPPKKNAAQSSGLVRVKLLAPDLPEGAVETIAQVTDKRADELIAAGQARRSQVSDFTFQKSA